MSDSINIELVLDGNAWGAMIGPNLQEGISGCYGSGSEECRETFLLKMPVTGEGFRQALPPHDLHRNAMVRL